MKAILTLIFVLFIGVTAQAKEAQPQPSVEVLSITIETATEANENTVARLYKRENAKIKKALSFTTKRSKAKLA